MAYRRNINSQSAVSRSFSLVFLCLISLFVRAQAQVETTDLSSADSSNTSPQEGPLDTIPNVDRIVNEKSNTSIKFYNDIQPYSAGLHEVTRRTNLSLGYRILVISDRSEAVVSQVMNEFYRSYRNLPTYKVFNSPYTELKAGDFSTYLEASYWAYQMKNDFRGAYVVQEVVNRRIK